MMFQRHAGDSRARQVPRDRRGTDDLGEARRLLRAGEDRRRRPRTRTTITRTTATAIGKAKTFRFDLSDLQPASFGGTVGQGEFKIFQDFLKNPKNVDGIAAALESAAAKAYASGK